MSIGSHQTTVGKNDERFTPRRLWEPLGPFATDAATSAVRPWSIGTERNVTPADNCLALDWRPFKRTWLNPPFNRFLVGEFVRRMCAHNNGILLLHVRTETEWFKPIFDAASALLFLAGRVIFCKPDGSPCTIENPSAIHYGKTANSGAPVVLAAFGKFDCDVLAGCDIEGAFIPLIFPRGVLVMPQPSDKSWRETVAEWLAQQRGPVRVSELYRAFAAHPKVKTNPHWREKIRQTLQRGAGKSIARDQWVAGA